MRLKKLLIEYFAKYIGKEFDQVAQDLERDTFMSADEAKDYGLIDEVLVSAWNEQNGED